MHATSCNLYYEVAGTWDAGECATPWLWNLGPYVSFQHRGYVVFRPGKLWKGASMLAVSCVSWQLGNAQSRTACQDGGFEGASSNCTYHMLSASPM